MTQPLSLPIVLARRPLMRETHSRRAAHGRHCNCATAGAIGPCEYGLHSRRHVPHGIGQALSGRGAGASRHRRRLLDRPHAGDQPAVQGIRQSHRPRHLRRNPARSEELSRRAAAHALCRLAGVHAAGPSGRSEKLGRVVEVSQGRELAPPLRPEEQHQREGQSSRRACRLRRRAGLRRMGRQGFADRSRMGIRRARRPRRRRVRLGRRAHARRQAHGQYLAGQFPARESLRAMASIAPRR